MSKIKGRAAGVPEVTKEQPQAGGTYIRLADGTLQRAEGPARGETGEVPVGDAAGDTAGSEAALAANGNGEG